MDSYAGPARVTIQAIIAKWGREVTMDGTRRSLLLLDGNGVSDDSPVHPQDHKP
jgi:hypothetical protein